MNEGTARISGLRLPTAAAAVEGRLAHKVALITGGGSGIGAAAAYAFAREGARVIVADSRGDAADEVAHRIEEGGGTAITARADVTKSDDVAAMVAQGVAHFGQLDCAFNNAGIFGSMTPVAEMDEAEFDRIIAVNLKGVWLSIRAELRAMCSESGGAIVNTSSFLAVGASAGTAAYSASKAGLDGMIRAVALEVGPLGIRINNVRPGVTDTPMLRAALDDDAMQPFGAHAALKRVGRAEDVADVAAWLCTDAARFVTGQAITVDGGFTIAGIR